MLRMMIFLLLTLWLTACAPQTPEDNQWRLTEVIYDGTYGDFSSIEPVLLVFRPPGILSVQACNSVAFVFDTKGVENTDEYRLRPGDSTARLCENGGTEQEIFIALAMKATNRYEVVGDTLVFSGKNAQLTFVIDNKARKPIDWQ